MSDSENENQQEPKIVIDTDWKEQVAREKEAADETSISSDDHSSDRADSRSAVEGTIDASTDDAITDDAGDVSTGDVSTGDPSEGEMPTPPPASFDVLLSMLFTQAMALLGQMPDPATGKTTVNKPYAKHYIDTLDMLCDKTKGNLSDDESKMLSEALHALRMMYVNVKA